MERRRLCIEVRLRGQTKVSSQREPTPADLERYERVLLDVDGTLLLGDVALPGAAEFVTRLRRAGARLCFGTNASFLTGETLIARLQSAGIDARPGEAVTGIEVLAAALAQDVGNEPVVSLAPEPVWLLLEALGVEQLAPSVLPASAPPLSVVVVAGFADDTDPGAVSAVALRVGPDTDVYVTSLDAGMVTATGIIPGPTRTVATLCAESGLALKTIATGKPSLWFSRAVLSILGDRGAMLAVGDSAADVVGAETAGWDSLLVLTGGISDPSECAVAPTMVATGVDVCFSASNKQ